MAGISWDCYEVSLLIELYKHFPTTYYLQTSQISELSELLLSRIEKANIPVESFSRGIDAITRRLYDVDYCITGQERSQTQHYQFFSAIVPVLNSDERLNRILANIARLTTKSIMKDKELQFEIWAKANYKDWSIAIANQEKANSFVLGKRLSVQPITQMTADDIKDIIKVVENFRLSYFRSAKLQNGTWILSSSNSDKRFRAAVLSGLQQYAVFLSDKAKIAKMKNTTEDDSGLVVEKESTGISGQNEDLSLEEYLVANKLEYIDNRGKGGALWVFGGEDISSHIVKLSKRGLKFYYKADGYKAKPETPAWYCKQFERTVNRVVVSDDKKAINEKTIIEQSIEKSINKKYTAIDENILLTLKKHFVYGFNTNSPIEIIRFKAQYESDHHEGCSIGDEKLKEIIEKCGLTYNGKVFVVNQEIKDRLRTLLFNHINCGEIVFYYNELYSLNEEWLYEGHIVDSDMLKLIIEDLFPKCQNKERYFIIYDERITEINALEKTILQRWGKQVLRTFAELKELLPFIPMDKVKYTLSYSKEFIWNSSETYARKDLFVISQDKINELCDLVALKCSDNGSVTFEELPLEDVAAENYELSENALHELVFSFLPESFSKNGRVISKTSEQHHNTVEAIQQFCKQHETCTMEELQHVMKEVEGSVRYPVVIEAANAVMVRVSRDDYVADDSVHFDVINIDKALDGIVVGDGIGLKEVYAFGAFPFCGYAWNYFVLESYCRRFSMKYRFECHTPNSENAGAIIRRDSSLSYHDIMAEAIARSGAKLDEKDVYDYLLSSGYLIRRRYSGMNSLLEKAAFLREGGR